MGEVVGMQYIFEVVEEVRDSLALGVGEDIVVVDFRAAWVRMQQSAQVSRL